MAENIRNSSIDDIPHTVGRRELRVPLLGPVETFRAHDAVTFFDNFWTLNEYGQIDRQGKARADLLSGPAFLLDAEKSRPAVVISGLSRVTSEAERQQERALRIHEADPEVYMTSITRTDVAVASKIVYVPESFFLVKESDWVEAKPNIVDPVPSTRLEILQNDVLIRQGETFGPEGNDPGVIAAHRAAYDRAVHAALEKTVELLC